MALMDFLQKQVQKVKDTYVKKEATPVAPRPGKVSTPTPSTPVSGPTTVGRTIDFARSVEKAVEDQAKENSILMAQSLTIPKYQGTQLSQGALPSPFPTVSRTLDFAFRPKEEMPIPETLPISSPIRDALREPVSDITKQGFYQVGEALLSGYRMLAEMDIFPEGTIKKDPKEDKLFQATLTGLDELGRRQIKLAEKYRKKGGIENAIFKIGSGGTSIATSLLTFALTKNPNIATAIAVGLDSIPVYNQARNSGLSPEDALLATASDAAVVGLLERYSFGLLGDIWGKPLKSKIGQIVKGAVVEGLTEGAQTGGQNIVAKNSYDKSRKVTDGLIESILVGGFWGGAISPIGMREVQEKSVEAINKLQKMGIPQEEAQIIVKTVVQSTLTETEKLKNNMESSFKENRLIGLKGGQEGTPGIDFPAPLPEGGKTVIPEGTFDQTLERQIEPDTGEAKQRGGDAVRFVAENQAMAEATLETINSQLASFTPEDLRTFKELKELKESRFAEGDVESMSKDEKIGKKTQKIIERYIEATGREELSMAEAFEEISDLPTVRNLIDAKKEVKKFQEKGGIRGEAVAKEVSGSGTTPLKITFTQYLKDRQKQGQKLLKTVKGFKQQVIEYAEKNIPKENRGEVLRLIRDVNTEVQIDMATKRIDEIVQKVDAQKVKQEVGDIQKKIKGEVKTQPKNVARIVKGQAKTTKQLIDQIKAVEGLPDSQRNLLSKAIVDAAGDQKKTFSLMRRAYERAQKVREEEIRKEFTDAKATFKRQANRVSMDYRKKLQDIFESFVDKPISDPGKASTAYEKLLDKLRAMAEFIEKHGELGVPAKHLRQLKLLTKKNVRELSPAERAELVNTVKQLMEIGKLKFERFKNHYSETVLNKNIEEAVSDIKNRDSLKDGKKTTKHKLTEFDDDVQFAARVFDKMDGRKGYKGFHATYGKKIMAAEIASEIGKRESVNTMIQDLINAEVSEIPDMDSQTRITIVGLYEQGAIEQVQTLMDKHGMKKLPDLSQEERAILNVFKKIANEKKDIMGPLWEEIKNLPFEEVENYIPIRYENDYTMSFDEAVDRDYKRVQNVRFASGFSRKEGVTLTPRTDIFNVMIEYIADRERFLNIAPVNYEYNPVFNSKKWRNAAGEVNTRYIDTYREATSRNGHLTQGDIWSGMLREGRVKFAKFQQAYKATSALAQPFSVFYNLGYVATYHPKLVPALLGNTAANFLIPGRTAKVVKGSPAAQVRTAGEEIVQLVESRDLPLLNDTMWKRIKRGYSKGGFAILQNLDLKTASAVQKTIYDELSKTMNGDEATAEADFIMNLLSSTSLITARPMALNRGEGMRAFFQFQNFALNAYGLVGYDLIRRGIIDGDVQTKFLAVIGLMIIALGDALEAEERTWIINQIKGTDYEANFIVNSLLSLPSKVPGLGQILKGFQIGIPIVEEVSEKLGAIPDLFTAESEYDRTKAAINVAEGVLLSFGVQGGSQIGDILEGVLLGERWKTSIYSAEEKEEYEQELLEKHKDGDLTKDQVNSKYKDFK